MIKGELDGLFILRALRGEYRNWGGFVEEYEAPKYVLYTNFKI